MRALARRVAEEHRRQPQAAADRLFHQVHAFDGHLALLVRRSLGKRAPQLFDARVLAAVDRAAAERRYRMGLP